MRGEAQANREDWGVTKTWRQLYAVAIAIEVENRRRSREGKPQGPAREGPMRVTSFCIETAL